MEFFTLNNGMQMPKSGLGTFLLTPKEAYDSTLTALKCGVRHIDTANGYMNEKAVGRAIKDSGIDRSEIFVTTKLWPSVYSDENAISDTLTRLQLDYVDMLILHQPACDYIHAYQMMEEAYKNGKVKALGLSNFSDEKIQEILDIAQIKPQLLTVECHPYYVQKKLREYLAPYKIIIEAWYPLGHGDHAMMDEPVFTKLAEKYHKTPVQIILRWHTQYGTSVIPGSKTPSHIEENNAIYDFTLTEKEMKEIDALDCGKHYYTQTQELLDKYASMAPDFNGQDDGKE